MLFLLLFLHLSTEVRSNICSKNVLFAEEVVQLYDQDRRTKTKETSVTFNIGLKETVCFEISGDANNNYKNEKYELTFVDVESIFTYKNSYDFAVGKPDVTCICDCPGLEDHCSPNRNSCVEDGRRQDGTCYNYYKGDEVSDGCGIFSPMGSAEICCSIGFEPFDNERYRAFEISTPVTRGSFHLETSTKGGTPVFNRTFAADLDKGSKLFIESVAVSFETPGKTIPIPDGWYFGRATSTEVLTNVKINGLNEWDINRLGWLKYDDVDELQYLPTEVKPVFSANTVNCKENAVDVKFASDYSNRQIVEAKSLEEYYASTVESAVRMDNKRDLVVSFRQFDKMKAMLTFSGARSVVQHYSHSSFSDFMGIAVLDKHSNRVLNITVYQAKGTLHGTMKIGGESVESFDFTVENIGSTDPDAVEPTDYTNYIQITQWCSNSAKTELCLHTGDSTEEICKVIYCESEENSQFEIPRNEIDYTAGRRESLGDPSVWKRYANPLEWFNGINGLQEVTCMLVVLLLTTLSILLLVLVYRKTNIRYHIVRLISLLPWWSKALKERMDEYAYIDESSDSSSSSSIGIMDRMMMKMRMIPAKPPAENHYEDIYSSASNSTSSRQREMYPSQRYRTPSYDSEDSTSDSGSGESYSSVDKERP